MHTHEADQGKQFSQKIKTHLKEILSFVFQYTCIVQPRKRNKLKKLHSVLHLHS